MTTRSKLKGFTDLDGSDILRGSPQNRMKNVLVEGSTANRYRMLLGILAARIDTRPKFSRGPFSSEKPIDFILVWIAEASK
jgi:hypothetical protein